MDIEPTMPPQRHALHEDAMAITFATLFMATGIALFSQARLVTGGTAGIGLLLQYATGLGFWATFSLVNAPFYLLGLIRMGWRFTLRTAIAVSLVAAFSAGVPQWMPLGPVNPWFAVLFGSALMGTGLLMLFRHRTALGGVNVLALYLNERWGWKIPVVQFSIDAITLLLSTRFIPLENIGLSLVGAAVVNLVLVVNHKPGRYLGTT